MTWALSRVLLQGSAVKRVKLRRFSTPTAPGDVAGGLCRRTGCKPLLLNLRFSVFLETNYRYWHLFCCVPSFIVGLDIVHMHFSQSNGTVTGWMDWLGVGVGVGGGELEGSGPPSFGEI